jgi:hypothetical protein
VNWGYSWLCCHHSPIVGLPPHKIDEQIRLITYLWFSARLLVKRENAKSRPESRPRHRRGFFGIHVRTSKSTRTFEFHTNSVSVSPRRFLKRWGSSSIAFEANTHPAQLPTPQKKLNWCGSYGSLDSEPHMCSASVS